MHPIYIDCLGVGPGWPCAERNSSAFLYRFNETTLLCDCGEGTSRSLKGAGIPLESIDHLLLTHLHFDHVGGLFFYLQGCWVEKRSRPLTIHAPAHGLPAIREMLRQGLVPPGLLPFPLKWQSWEEAESELLSGVRVTPHRSSHLDELLGLLPAEMPQDGQAFSFVLEAQGKRIVHSGDLGGPGDLEPLLGSPTDLLLCELAHFDPGDLAGFLSRRPVKRVVLVHLPVDLWPKRGELSTFLCGKLPGMQVGIAVEGETITV
jgi:ribonuclease Z